MRIYKNKSFNEDIYNYDIIGTNTILELNLQFFADDAGEKTEPATSKKLDDARKEGKVAKSKEVANALGLLGMFILIKVGGGFLGYQMMDLFDVIYSKIPEFTKFYGGVIYNTTFYLIFRKGIVRIIIIILPVLIVGLIISFISEVLQVRWKLAPKAMKPKFSKLNPVEGFKRIISINSIAELVKSLAKIGLIIIVANNYLSKNLIMIYNLYDCSLIEGIGIIGDTVTDLGIRIAAVYMIIALADFLFQKWKFAKDMRMTKQEIKEEYKTQEGDPIIKSQIRQKMRESSMRRMMQELPKADVVITNPTHYAIAILYDAKQDEAPKVIAKGKDYLAQKIKEVAKENKVEIVEDKPLARMLYSNVDIGGVIPPELYQAVAQILAMVYHIQGKI